VPAVELLQCAGMLTYPIGSVPEPGSTLKVAEGVHWLRMPLPFALNHINLWTLEDDAAWTLVDTGLKTATAEETWQALFATTMAGRPARRVICTHMHPDHVGMSGWLTRHFQCALWMTRLEYITCRMLVADTGREAPLDALRFYRASGWDDEALEHYRSRFGGFGKVVHQLPDSYRRVTDGETLRIGVNTWHAVIGRGHCPEHLCLYCPQLKLMISGDQVLPKITSNVSVFPTEPAADPLKDWLESLASIKARVPDDVLVLPSHGEPFRGLHERLDRLMAGHEESLVRLHEALAQPKRALDIFPLLFGRKISGDLLSMATGESVAHLNCLIGRGLARFDTDENGVAWYRGIYE
jgi:glyoxylase-like metal-dependent hydrolase (beta-lactamase superfamily II)